MFLITSITIASFVKLTNLNSISVFNKNTLFNNDPFPLFLSKILSDSNNITVSDTLNKYSIDQYQLPSNYTYHRLLSAVVSFTPFLLANINQFGTNSFFKYIRHFSKYYNVIVFPINNIIRFLNIDEKYFISKDIVEFVRLSGFFISSCTLAYRMKNEIYAINAVIFVLNHLYIYDLLEPYTIMYHIEDDVITSSLLYTEIKSRDLPIFSFDRYGLGEDGIKYGVLYGITSGIVKSFDEYFYPNEKSVLGFVIDRTITTKDTMYTDFSLQRKSLELIVESAKWFYKSPQMIKASIAIDEDLQIPTQITDHLTIKYSSETESSYNNLNQYKDVFLDFYHEQEEINDITISYLSDKDYIDMNSIHMNSFCINSLSV